MTLKTSMRDHLGGILGNAIFIVLLPFGLIYLWWDDWSTRREMERGR